MEKKSRKNFSGNCGKYWGKSATEDNEWEDRTRGDENILPHWWGVYNGKKYYKKTKFMIGLHHASSLRMPREKKCPAGTINELEVHDSPWLWEDKSPSFWFREN